MERTGRGDAAIYAVIPLRALTTALVDWQVICGYEEELMEKLNPRMIHFLLMPYEPHPAHDPLHPSRVAAAAPGGPGMTRMRQGMGMEPNLARKMSIACSPSMESLSSIGSAVSRQSSIEPQVIVIRDCYS
jgi:hypothetical protein